MVKVVAKNILKDGNKEKALNMLEEMIEKTRKEPGCIKYELFEDSNNPNVITFIEEWESMEALEAHIDSDHFKKIIPAVGELVVEATPVEIYKQIR